MESSLPEVSCIFPPHHLPRHPWDQGEDRSGLSGQREKDCHDDMPPCHAAERISKEYKLTTTQVKSYYDTFHGLSYQGGDTYSANCASCHGVHDIRSSSDPKSMIHKDNLQKTCGSCHRGASENFAKGRCIRLLQLAEKIWGKRWSDG